MFLAFIVVFIFYLFYLFIFCPYVDVRFMNLLLSSMEDPCCSWTWKLTIKIFFWSDSDEAIAAYIDIRGAFLKDLSLNNIIKVNFNLSLYNFLAYIDICASLGGLWKTYHLTILSRIYHCLWCDTIELWEMVGTDKRASSREYSLENI